jgi:hypothetical protein
MIEQSAGPGDVGLAPARASHIALSYYSENQKNSMPCRHRTSGEAVFLGVRALQPVVSCAIVNSRKWKPSR